MEDISSTMDLIPTLEFLIPSPIVGKGRPRLCRRSGRVFTPKRTREYEKRAKAIAAQAMQEASLEPLQGPVGVRLVIAYPTPSRRRKEQGKYCASGPPKYADADNTCKAVLDSLNKVIYDDDCQVVALTVTKRFNAVEEPPGVYVQVFEL